MEEKQLSPLEAWDEFYREYVPPGGVIPNELVVANATRNGKQRQSNGKAKRLGVERIRRLLEKYAPDKYTFFEAHFKSK